MSPLTRQHPRHDARGVTLVELMVALLIGAILTGIAVQVFSRSLEVQQTTEAFSRIQQNARFASILLSRDLRQADSFGCASQDNLNSIVAGGANLAGPAVAGQENPGGASINNSDTITLRGGGSLNTTVAGDPGGTASPITLANVGGLGAGVLVMVSNCQGAVPGGAVTTEVFEVTNVTAASGNFDVAHAGPANAPATLVNTYLNNDAAMSVRQTVYRVADSGGVPTLQASINGGGFDDLISDVYSMQIVYGEDTNADSVANRYVPANLVGSMDDVVAVRIQLIVMGGQPNIARTSGWTAPGNIQADGDLVVTYGAAFGGNPVELPNGQIGELITITSALRGRLP